MQDRVLERNRGRRAGRTGLFLTAAVVTLILLCVGCLGVWESYRRRTQMQDDPAVARVWVVGTTFGARHELRRGSTLQQWLSSHHIALLGDSEVLQSQYGNDPAGMEIWFNYQSYLIGRPDLECHRINAAGTAFVDDLGQPYHGFLDIHGKTVGVYLPAYDHAAREIRCVVKWMPRRPDIGPASRPMVFTVKLPPARRALPPAASLPRTVTLTKGGVTVTVDAARLGAPKLDKLAVGQRDITFHLKIDGGEIANDNVASDLNLTFADTFRAGNLRVTGRAAVPRFQIFTNRSALSPLPTLQRGAIRLAQRQLQAVVTSSLENPLTLTDPYGIPLVTQGQSITPLDSKEMVERARHGEGMVWVVPVNGAGKGTDAISIHLDVLPKAKTGRQLPGAPIPFDLCVPVQTGDEI